LVYSEIGAGATYTVPPGTVITIQSNGIFFPGATFTSLPNDILSLANGTILNVTPGVASSGGTGTALFNGAPFTNPVFNGCQLNTGPTGLSVAAGGITWTTNSTYTFASTGATAYWFFDGSPGHEVIVTEGNQIFTCPPGTTLGVPYPLVGITNSTIDTDGPVTIPVGSVITVAERDFIQYGVTGITFSGVGLGGGGYTGGGNAALITTIPVTGAVGPTAGNEPAGGGAGSWGFIPLAGMTGTTYGGSGSLPYVNQYNRYGTYGSGTTGPTGNAGFLIVEQIIAPSAQQAALNVNGSITINNAVSTLVPTANIVCPGGSSQVLGNVTCNTVTTTGAISASGTVTFAGGNILGSTAGTGWILTGTNGTSTCTLAQNQTSNILLSSTPVSAPDFTATSDIRSKTKIETVDSALDKVLKLRGVYFERISDPGKRHVGVIAQEIEEIVPEVVHTDGEDGMKSVSYGSIIGLLIEAIKDQQEMIKKLM
jgi:hypothetical protein